MEELELCYAPRLVPHATGEYCRFFAGNILRGDAPVMHWNEVESLDKNAWYILDTRLPEEGTLGSIPGSHNIPLQQLRQHLDELPKDRKILVYCATGQRSYFAVRVLRQHGFDAYNLSGGYKTFAEAVREQSYQPEMETKTMTLSQTPANAAHETSSDTNWTPRFAVPGQSQAL